MYRNLPVLIVFQLLVSIEFNVVALPGDLV